MRIFEDNILDDTEFVEKKLNTNYTDKWKDTENPLHFELSFNFHSRY